jgi:hypothetical protein
MLTSEEFTSARRLELYKKALRLIELEVKTKGYYNLGLCFAISEELRYHEPSPYVNMEAYPELIKYQPEKLANDYWWPCGDFQSRIEVLKAVIAELEEQIALKS